MPPYEDWAEVSENPDELIAKLQQDARAAKATPEAAAGLVIAVGNYEYLDEKRPEVLDAAGSLLEELGRERSKYWG
jgi:hypothetical protein